MGKRKTIETLLQVIGVHRDAKMVIFYAKMQHSIYFSMMHDCKSGSAFLTYDCKWQVCDSSEGNIEIYP